MAAPNTYTKVAGTWKQVNRIYHKINGAWIEINRAWTKVNGQWKLVFVRDGGTPAQSYQVVYGAGIHIEVNPWIDAGSPAGRIVLNVIIEQNAIIYSDNISIPAMTFAGIDDTSEVNIEMQSLGFIMARGGNGGDGGLVDDSGGNCIVPMHDFQGEDGGPGLNLNCTTTIVSTATFPEGPYIYGGFGGGRGGSGTCVGQSGAGGGGGGGAPRGQGGSGGTNVYANPGEPLDAFPGLPADLFLGGAGGAGQGSGAPGSNGNDPNTQNPGSGLNGPAIVTNGYVLNYTVGDIDIQGEII